MNEYKILTLGASGAGKTVFLASMFKRLSTASTEGFFLGFEDEERKKEDLLDRIYSELQHQNIWPKTTRGQITECNFICYVKDEEFNNYPACKFSYLDYPGGLLTDYKDLQEEDDFNFSQAASEADAVLGIIDGYKLLSFMKNKDYTTKDMTLFLNKEMPRIMRLLYKVNRHVSVHLIISKWDILQNHYSLKDIKNKLETIDEFKNVVDSRNKAGCSIFLIPVSSVGYGFANLLPDGQMQINKNVIPKPFQVEVPLALTLVDKISAPIYQRQRSHQDDPSSKISLSFKILIYFFIIGILLFWLLSQFGVDIVLFVAIIGICIYMLFTNLITSQTERKREKLSDRQALSQIKNRCDYIRGEFLARFPDANLGAK